MLHVVALGLELLNATRMKCFNAFLDYFISPYIKDKSEDYKLARYVLYLLSFTVVFISFYTALFFLYDDVYTPKVVTNIVGLFVSMLGFGFLKYSKSLNTPLFLYVILTMLLTSGAVATSGGIYSIELIWLIINVLSSYHFIGKKEGLFITIMAFVIINLFFWLEQFGVITLLDKSTAYNKFYQFGNNLFALIYVSATSYIMIRRNQSLKETILKEQDKQVREEIARDFHDELGNKLAIITSTSNLLKNNLGRLEEEKIVELTDRIERHSSVVYKGFKDFLWSIDSNNDLVTTLFVYLKDFGEDLYLYTETKFFSEFIERSDQRISLSLELKRNLIFIVKEIMTNSFKHAKANQVIFTLIESDNEVIIDVMDNGMGFSDVSINGMGLKNIEQRIQLIKATLTRDVDCNGTSYQIIVPI